jgi:hypothetical protein
MYHSPILILQTLRYSFFFVWTFLPIYCRCRRLLLHLISLYLPLSLSLSLCQHTHTHTHTHTVWLLWTRNRPVAENSDETQHSRETFMPQGIFEPAIPASERLHSYALDSAATGIGHNVINDTKLLFLKWCILWRKCSLNFWGNLLRWVVLCCVVLCCVVLCCVVEMLCACKERRTYKSSG